MSEAFKKAFFQLIKFLETIEKEKDTKYYIVGGLLSSIYAVYRTTQDIDFVIDLQSKNIELSHFISLLGKNSFKPFQDWKTTLELANDTKLIQFFDEQEMVKYDCHLIDKYNQNMYKRIGPLTLENRVREKIFNIECWVASKEDFILSKLVYGGWQDYSDALGCWLRFGSKLNIVYLEKTSQELRVEREFQLLRSGIDDPDEYFTKLKNY